MREELKSFSAVVNGAIIINRLQIHLVRSRYAVKFSPVMSMNRPNRVSNGDTSSRTFDQILVIMSAWHPRPCLSFKIELSGGVYVSSLDMQNSKISAIQ